MGESERDFLDWLAARCRPATGGSSPVTLGIGDDMGGLTVRGDQILVTADMLLDGVHFDSARHAPSVIGRKAAACSLSDCAAMAVQPVGAVVSLALPADFGLERAKSLIEGIIEICTLFDCPLVGGDTTGWSHPLVVDVTMLASPHPNITPVRRSGARVGDRIFVTGPLGGSIHGHHLSFTPRVKEARRIAETLGGRLHAMMDISDGLGIDLDRMMTASGTRATLDRSAVLGVSSKALQKLGLPEEDAIGHVLSDGEDFELLIAADVDDAVAGNLGLIPLGVIESAHGLRMKDGKGKTTSIKPTGWQHF